MSQSPPDSWYETFFQGTNCELWEKVASPEWTEAEVAFLIDVLGLTPGQRLLDIPCGNGRHAISLAKKGYFLTAVDISEEFIRKLQASVQAQNLPVNIIHGNMVLLDLPSDFDAAFCLGNSFGYVNHTHTKHFVRKIANSLKAGGRLLIHSGMVAESILPNFSPHETYELPDLTMDIHNTYVADGSYVISQLTYSRNGRQSEQHAFKHYVYTIGEIQRMLHSHQLETIGLYRSTQKEPFRMGDPQLYLVAEKG
ncbi:MAG: class I SAM-dependent methyltransferase [Bacteroidetes bacterium]|nr:MAG: class I SAM-dependent methyltransferase [Bacteroidota bacterium]